MSTPDEQSTNVFLAENSFDSSTTLTELRLLDGRRFRIPTALLSEANDVTASENQAYDTDGSTLVVPIVEESLNISKRIVATGKVRLAKTVQAHDVVVDEPLAVHTWTVERVALNVPVEAAPVVRQEGNTTIYPLLEEELVLTKQLVLKEEVRVTRNDSERRETQTVSLRREQVTVDRETPD